MPGATRPGVIMLAAALLAGPQLASANDGAEPEDLLEKMQRVNAQYAELLDKMDSIDARRERLKQKLSEGAAGEAAPAPSRVTESRPEPEPVATPQQSAPVARAAPAPEPAQAAPTPGPAQAEPEPAPAPAVARAPAPRPEPARVPTEVGAEQKRELEKQAQEMPELPRVSDAVGGVLTPRGRLTIEPSVGFTYSSVNRIAVEGFTILPALLIGIIDVVEADRDTYTARLTGRYGVTNRFETELTSSWVYRDDATRSREFLTGAVEDSVFKAQGKGFGDLELGLRYQFKRRSPTAPFIVGNLRIKSDTGTDPFEIATMSTLSDQPQLSTELPTGSGFWSVNPSLTFIYPSDPVVFFGSLGYLWTLEDDKGTTLDDEGNILGFGKVDPGDAYRMSFGFGLGLNESSSFSISYSLDQFTRTRIETASTPSIAGSDVTIGKLLIGYSLRLSNGLPLNLAVGIGTTEDAPDTDLTFRMPFHFGD